MKVCLEPDCPTLTRTARCTQHTRQRDRERGSSSARGYGAAHQRLRLRWAKRIARGGVTCARCGDPIELGQAWDLGHDDEDRTKYTGPECVGCNRATSGRG